MDENDIRWEQRFANFSRAIAKLTEVVEGLSPKWNRQEIDDDEFDLSDLEIEGAIQRFEYTHELAWNVMKDYAIFQGNTSVGGSRDATREAFKLNLIADAQGWMNMIKSRNQTSHSYDEATAKEIFIDIINVYYPLFRDFKLKMQSFLSGKQKDLFSKEL
jgi:nucleotidyltransferase substrate binding protein (TIGR01987 family)